MNPTLINGAITFHEAPVEIREQVAFRAETLPGALCRLKMQLGLSEAVLVSTCNRVEYFGLTTRPDLAQQAWPEFLQSFHRIAQPMEPYSRHHLGRACIEHLFHTVSGLESMVVGETEIFGQVKEAYKLAQQQGLTRKRLNRLFQSSFAAAKEVRTSTQITRGSVSVGSVASELAGKLFGHLGERDIMILGAGEMSERTARALLTRGVRCLFVANRTYAKAQELAAALQGEAVPWEDFEARVEAVDIVICSTAAPHYVLTRDRLASLQPRRQGRPLFLIDLAVPRNIDPSAHHLDDIYLYDIDDLQSIADRHQRDRLAEVERCRLILAPHVQRCLEWMHQQESSLDVPASGGQLTMA